MACLLWKKKMENQIKKNLIMKGTNKIIKAMRYGIYLQYCVVSNWGNVMIHEFLRQVSGY